MTKKVYPNPFELYINVMQYNIKTLNKLIDMNELFSELAQKRISVLGNGPKKINSEVKIKDIKYHNPNEKPSISFEDFVEPFSKNFAIESKPITEPLEDYEEIAHDSIQNSPISIFEELTAEQTLKLNLFGIHSANDFERYNLSTISKNTGISESELNQIITQVRKYLP